MSWPDPIHHRGLDTDPDAFDLVWAFTADWMDGAWTEWPWPGAPNQPRPLDAVLVYRRSLP